MAPVQSIKFQTTNFPIFCARITVIFWTTCIARGVFSLVIMGNGKQVLHWLEVVIAFVSRYRQDLPEGQLCRYFVYSRADFGVFRWGDTLHRSRSNLAARSGPEVRGWNVMFFPFLNLLPAGCARRAALPVFRLLTGRFWVFSPRRGNTLHRSRWNLARRSGPSVRSYVPNFALIGPGVGFTAPKTEKKSNFTNIIARFL